MLPASNIVKDMYSIWKTYTDGIYVLMYIQCVYIYIYVILTVYNCEYNYIHMITHVYVCVYFYDSSMQCVL